MPPFRRSSPASDADQRQPGFSPVAPVAPFSANDSNDLARPLERTVTSEAAGQRSHANANGQDGSSTVRASGRVNPLKNQTENDATARNAEIPARPNPEKRGVLNDGHIRQLAKEYLDEAAAEFEATADVDRAALERKLRRILVAEGVPPELVEVEFERIMDVLAAF